MTCMFLFINSCSSTDICCCSGREDSWSGLKGYHDLLVEKVVKAEYLVKKCLTDITVASYNACLTGNGFT